MTNLGFIKERKNKANPAGVRATRYHILLFFFYHAQTRIHIVYMRARVCVRVCYSVRIYMCVLALRRVFVFDVLHCAHICNPCLRGGAWALPHCHRFAPINAVRTVLRPSRYAP